MPKISLQIYLKTRQEKLKIKKKVIVLNCWSFYNWQKSDVKLKTNSLQKQCLAPLNRKRDWRETRESREYTLLYRSSTSNPCKSLMNFMEDVDIKNLRILDLKSSGMQVNSRERWNQVRWYWRLYIKYVGGGRRRAFAGPINVLCIYWQSIKYCWKFLMGHLCSPFLILIF